MIMVHHGDVSHSMGEDCKLCSTAEAEFYESLKSGELAELLKDMQPKCIGLFGKLFGHKFGSGCSCYACSHCKRCGVER